MSQNTAEPVELIECFFKKYLVDKSAYSAAFYLRCQLVVIFTFNNIEMVANIPRVKTMLIAVYLLSSFTISLMVHSSFGKRSAIQTPSNILRQNLHIHRGVSLSRLNMASSDDEEAKLDSEIDKAMWFDPTPIIKNVSLPNIFVGSILGAVIAIVTIFAPFFLPDDSPFSAGKHLSSNQRHNS